MNPSAINLRLPRFTPLQIFVHVGSVVPFIWLMFNYWTDNLTANPIQALTLRTGKFALIWLLLSLACTPINTVFGYRQVLKVRRALGLYAFFYASLHFLIFTGLDYQFDIDLLKEAIFEKRYALIGFAALIILLPIAITSTRGWMKRLKQNWKRLHKFVYLAGILVIIHYIWQVKSDIRVPLAYGAVLATLLILRIPVVRRFASQLRQGQWIKRIRSSYKTSWKYRFRPISGDDSLDGTEHSKLIIKD
jgi:sulfoxide reductase heme-binding subunit YedZ